jgi:large repetitive protein
MRDLSSIQVTIAYTYDDLYQLTNEKITDAVNGDRSSSYVYDKVGNRLGKTVNFQEL